MFPPGIFGPVGVHPPRARSTDHQPVRRRWGGGESPVAIRSALNTSTLQSRAGFSLLELVIVVGIIGLLLVLMAPAFTTIRGGTDVTSAAYTIKGVLDTARTYAKANNTYAWVGFSGSIGSTLTGSVALCVVASKDGTDLGTSVNQVGNRVDITAGLTPIGKVMRLENAHIGDTGTPQTSPSPAPEFESESRG